MAGGDDDVIARAVRLLPRAAHSASGVPTTQELQVRPLTVSSRVGMRLPLGCKRRTAPTLSLYADRAQARFAAVARAARRAAVTPPNSGVLGHAVGIATAALLVPTPSQSLSPPAAAPQTTSSSSSSGSFASTALGLLPEWVRQQIALPSAAAPPPSSDAPAAPGVIDQVWDPQGCEARLARRNPPAPASPTAGHHVCEGRGCCSRGSVGRAAARGHCHRRGAGPH